MREDLQLLEDAIDVDARSEPAFFPRPPCNAQVAEAAVQYGMRGFVLEDHEMSTPGWEELASLPARGVPCERLEKMTKASPAEVLGIGA